MGGFFMAVDLTGAPVDPQVLTAVAAAAGARAAGGVAPYSSASVATAHTFFAGVSHGAAASGPAVHDDLVCVADARLDNSTALERLLGAELPSPRLEGLSPAALVLAAYRRWGTQAAEHLLGDFAFAVYDARRRSVVAARDAGGARQIVYCAVGGRVVLATEPSMVLAAAPVPRAVDELALLADLHDLEAPGDRTAYARVAKLRPAHSLRVTSDLTRTWRYWDIDPTRRVQHRDPADYDAELRSLLVEAVAARLDAAGTGGMLLSGGIDSTAVAAAWGVARDRPGVAPLRGFSWRFVELPQVDERATSDRVAAALELPVTTVDGDDGWPLHQVTDHGPTVDDPYVWMYQYLVDRTLDAARSSGVRTMLTTDRGDDLTAGWVFDDLGLLARGRLGAVWHERRVYQQQYGASWRQYVGKRLLAPAATSLWPPAYGTHVRRSVRRLVGSRGQRPLAPWIPSAAAHRVGLSDALAADLHLPRTRSVGRLHRYRAAFEPTSLRQTEMRERTFARAGLRHADPWNDRRIAEFVCAVPQWLLQRQSAPKAMVARAARDLVPEAARSAVDEPARSNPGPLFRRGFDEREVDTVRRLMTGSRAADLGLLDPAAVLATYDDYLAGRAIRHDFWSPLTVELWLRRWWD